MASTGVETDDPGPTDTKTIHLASWDDRFVAWLVDVKTVMNLAVTDERGEAIDYVTAAIESFGKAFLLSIDVLIGWLAMEGEHVRLFNRLSSTIVVEVPEDDSAPEGVEYVPPGK